MRYITLALMCLSLIGCRTTQQYLFSEINPNAMVNSSLMLESVEEHEAMIREFMVHHPNGTEQEKIQFLLSALKNSKLKFRRNGSGYDGNACAKWLAWKMKHPQFRDDPILTGWDLAANCAGQDWYSPSAWRLTPAWSRCRAPRAV